MVKPGMARMLRRAFVFELKNGNRGLAMRTSGGRPLGAYRPTPLGKNLWLLYGPSVDQVFGGTGVAQEISPELVDYLEHEFHRLLDAEIG